MNTVLDVVEGDGVEALASLVQMLGPAKTSSKAVQSNRRFSNSPTCCFLLPIGSCMLYALTVMGFSRVAFSRTVVPAACKNFIARYAHHMLSFSPAPSN